MARRNFAINSDVQFLKSRQLKKSPRAYTTRLTGEERWESNLIELRRTRTNSNKLEHP